MLSSEVAQSLKSYGHFSDLGVGSLAVTAMLDFSGNANTSILGEDNTATPPSYFILWNAVTSIGENRVI